MPLFAPSVHGPKKMGAALRSLLLFDPKDTYCYETHSVGIHEYACGMVFSASGWVPKFKTQGLHPTDDV